MADAKDAVAKKSKKKSTKKKKKAVRFKAQKDDVQDFMIALIHAGYIGEEISEESSDRNFAATQIRRQAEVLARTLRRFDD